MRHSVNLVVGALCFAAVGTFSVAPAAAMDPGPMPKMISIATFDVGASGYAELSAVNDAIFKKFGVKIRNVPIGNSVARAIATKSGTTQLWQSCSAYYPCAEGIDDFSKADWGPQPIRVFYMSNRAANYSPATTKKSGIKSMAEVKGKRVAWIIGNPAINMQTEAYLAFAKLTVKDVTLVEFPGYTASLRGMIAGQVDVALAASSSTGSYEIETSPVGLQWIPIPHNDTEGWKRIQARATFVAPVTVTSGAGIAKGTSLEAGSYPCPVVVAYANQNPKLVYWMTKMIVESWDLYKDTLSAAPYWQVDRALQARLAEPWHDGAIAYFKDIGKWTPELQARQDELVKRQTLLIATFAKAKQEFKASGKDAKEFPAFWEAHRIATLKTAGMPLY